MDNKKTLESILDGFHAYEKIVDKEIHYVYLKDKQYYELVLSAKKSNFMHLCGISYEHMNPKQFYMALKTKKISQLKITKKNDGSTNQKLQIIKQLEYLITCKIRIIDKKSSYLKLTFDKAIRSNKMIFCLGLQEKHMRAFVPTSLLNLKSVKGKSIKAGYPVHCIYFVDKYSKEIKIIDRTIEFKEYEKTETYMYRRELETI
ncbi:MAG: PBECR4 domain-containing protein [Bacilli bacterium]